MVGEHLKDFFCDFFIGAKPQTKTLENASIWKMFEVADRFSEHAILMRSFLKYKNRLLLGQQKRRGSKRSSSEQAGGARGPGAGKKRAKKVRALIDETSEDEAGDGEGEGGDDEVEDEGSGEAELNV